VDPQGYFFFSPPIPSLPCLIAFPPDSFPILFESADFFAFLMLSDFPKFPRLPLGWPMGGSTSPLEANTPSIRKPSLFGLPEFPKSPRCPRRLFFADVHLVPPRSPRGYLSRAALPHDPKGFYSSSFLQVAPQNAGRSYFQMVQPPLDSHLCLLFSLKARVLHF